MNAYECATDIGPGGATLLDGSAGPPEVRALRDALAAHAASADMADLDLAFARGREMVEAVHGAPGAGPASVADLRRLALTVPEFDELLHRAADGAGEALTAACAGLWMALELTSPLPAWTTAEHEAARIAFACACRPGGDLASPRLPANLRRIAAARLARLLTAELCREETPWRRALGGGYDSLRHRCAPRTRRRSRGLSDLVREDADCRGAVTARLERWLTAGAGLGDLGAELEAAVVHARTPARLA